MTVEAARKPRYRTKPQPVCPVHGVPMRVRRSKVDVRYCYCPCPGCKESAKQRR